MPVQKRIEHVQGEYAGLTSQPRAQNPAPFVILSRKLHIAVSYNSNDLDISCASVADRLRKQVNKPYTPVLPQTPNPNPQNPNLICKPQTPHR